MLNLKDKLNTICQRAADELKELAERYSFVDKALSKDLSEKEMSDIVKIYDVEWEDVKTVIDSTVESINKITTPKLLKEMLKENLTNKGGYCNYLHWKKEAERLYPLAKYSLHTIQEKLEVLAK